MIEAGQVNLWDATKDIYQGDDSVDALVIYKAMIGARDE